MTSSDFTLESLCTIQMETTQSFQANLLSLATLIESSPSNALVVAPEVVLTGFAYERFEEAAAFSAEAVAMLLPLSQKRIILYTQIEREGEAYYNVANVLFEGSVVHKQRKAKLFTLGEELKHFSAGESEAVLPFEVGGITLGILICFEMRFTALWEQLKGADVIAVPSMWGRERSEHFVTLSKALAIANQSYVCACDSANAATTAQSGIITPFGEEHRNGESICLDVPYDAKEIKRMRRYIDVGLRQ